MGLQSLHKSKMGKPRGLIAARKLRTRRREQIWHDKDYKNPILVLHLKLIHLEELPMPRVLFLKKLEQKLNSLTLLSVSVSEYSLSKMERKLQLLSLMMVV